MWDVETVLLPRSYTDMVADAGGVPVLLPPRVEAAAAVDRLDAVVLAGGADIAADRYGRCRTRGPGRPARTGTRPSWPCWPGRWTGASRCSGCAAARSC